MGHACLQSLNEDLLQLLEGFLTSDEFLPLMYTSQQLRREYHQRRRLSLDRKHSRRYAEDEEFRARVLSAIVDPHKQLIMNLSGCDVTTHDVSALGGVHTLNMYGCDKVSNVSALGGVHTLNLSMCNQVSDVSALGGVHTLDLSCCDQVSDVSALGGVHTLDLASCDQVSDVSALGGVHTLDL
jgi:hypothetical protein